MTKILVIKAKHFVAGIEPGKHTAPVIAYMFKWPESKIRAYCEKKGWEVDEISIEPGELRTGQPK